MVEKRGICAGPDPVNVGLSECQWALTIRPSADGGGVGICCVHTDSAPYLLLI